MKPIVIEDDDDDVFDGRKSKKTAMKEEPSSSVAVKRRKRPHNRGLRFDSGGSGLFSITPTFTDGLYLSYV